jgi:hypothetical protein
MNAVDRIAVFQVGRATGENLTPLLPARAKWVVVGLSAMGYNQVTVRCYETV